MLRIFSFPQHEKRIRIRAPRLHPHKRVDYAEAHLEKSKVWCIEIETKIMGKASQISIQCMLKDTVWIDWKKNGGKISIMIVKNYSSIIMNSDESDTTTHVRTDSEFCDFIFPVLTSKLFGCTDNVSQNATFIKVLTILLKSWTIILFLIMIFSNK